ncbi:MAG: hypothetical protein MSA72_07355 [Lachnospiraceae bacterium]|nr:hypothetical protein [Lachnospiraceae bacterium]
MKNQKMFITKTLGTICSFCMAVGFALDWGGCSILFFGEYPFPDKE